VQACCRAMACTFLDVARPDTILALSLPAACCVCCVLCVLRVLCVLCVACRSSLSCT
jgi:hypothetical protein